ncbi:MAG: hypothetical protein ACREFH_15620, partial [Stellaceae bacterium]
MQLPLLVAPAQERVKKSKTGWISAAHPSRQSLRDFLRMRSVLNAISSLPHAEERLWARLEARTVPMQ